MAVDVRIKNTRNKKFILVIRKEDARYRSRASRNSTKRLLSVQYHGDSVIAIEA